MRVKSVVDTHFRLIIFTAIAAMVGLSVFITAAIRFSFSEALPGYVVVLLASGLLLWLLYGSYYEFRGRYLYCRSGPFVVKIPYASIRLLALSDNMQSSLALSTKRITIERYDDGSITEITMISPEGRELFMARLKQLCLNLECVA